MNVKERLLELADPDYREFQEKLMPGVTDLLGVRMPQLKKLAGEILASDWRGFLDQVSGETCEERQLQGLVTAGAWRKMEPEELLARTEAFLPRIDNWAVCDTFCSAYKAADGPLGPLVWEFIRPCFRDGREYRIRFAVVMALTHYCREDCAREVFSLLDGIESREYYVRMAVAWAVSVFFVKVPELTWEYLKDNRLDDWTYNKALQKITESLRVDRETKMQIRAMKRPSKKGREI